MDDAVSTWIRNLDNGGDDAAQIAWNCYFDKLVRLAGDRLRGTPRRVADEEDVALSAMNSFLRGAKAGKYPWLADRDDLWRLLVTITVRKVVALQRRHHAQKRGGGHVRGESVFGNTADTGERNAIAQVLDKEPTPELASQFAEEVERLLGILNDALLKQVALLKLEGHSNAEIAQLIDRCEGTVERKIRMIRRIWQPQLNR